MQRLFTTFPNSWPGAGLLLLRIAAALPLLAVAATSICKAADCRNMLVELTGLATGGLLLAGFFTPFAAGFAVLLQAWLGLHDDIPARDGHGLQALMDAAVVMLGPGAWSVDARLFGRKRIPMKVE